MTPSSAWARTPSPPTSAKPDENTIAALVPRAPQLLHGFEHKGRGHRDDRRVGRLRQFQDHFIGAQPLNFAAVGIDRIDRAAKSGFQHPVDGTAADAGCVRPTRRQWRRFSARSDTRCWRSVRLIRTVSSLRWDPFASEDYLTISAAANDVIRGSALRPDDVIDHAPFPMHSARALRDVPERQWQSCAGCALSACTRAIPRHPIP